MGLGYENTAAGGGGGEVVSYKARFSREPARCLWGCWVSVKMRSHLTAYFDASPTDLGRLLQLELTGF